jgi:hypothetical protein
MGIYSKKGNTCHLLTLIRSTDHLLFYIITHLDVKASSNRKGEYELSQLAYMPNPPNADRWILSFGLKWIIEIL